MFDSTDNDKIGAEVAKLLFNQDYAWGLGDRGADAGEGAVQPIDHRPPTFGDFRRNGLEQAKGGDETDARGGVSVGWSDSQAAPFERAAPPPCPSRRCRVYLGSVYAD